MKLIMDIWRDGLYSFKYTLYIAMIANIQIFRGLNKKYIWTPYIKWENTKTFFKIDFHTDIGDGRELFRRAIESSRKEY